MMKKVLFFFTLIFVNFFCLSNVLASETICSYSSKYFDKFELKYNSVSGAIDYDLDLAEISISEENDFVTIDLPDMKQMNGKCYESLHVYISLKSNFNALEEIILGSPVSAVLEFLGINLSLDVHVLISGSSLEELKALEKDGSLGYMIDKVYYDYEYKEESVNYKGDLETFTAVCPQLQTHIDKIDKSQVNINDCDNVSCINAEIKTKKQQISELKALCSNISQSGTLDATDACIKSCLKLSETFSNMGIIEDQDLQCSLSTKIVSSISNIVKLIKYIIPVLIIILSILDFLKAITGDTADKMKKAQGRFVKRLVIAVLIFLLPLIIEFILGKLGFIVEGCGVINF